MKKHSYTGPEYSPQLQFILAAAVMEQGDRQANTQRDVNWVVQLRKYASKTFKFSWTSARTVMHSQQQRGFIALRYA